jgi:Sensors of blue-light using FAD
MTADLHRLVYYSRNRIPGPPAEVAAEVDAILASARRNNAAIGVTGALIFSAGIFAQVLEGARHDIEVIFEHIQRDERHGDVQVLAFEAVLKREFPAWSMAYVGRSREGQELVGHIADATGFDPKRLEGERILGIIRAIASEEESPAR